MNLKEMEKPRNDSAIDQAAASEGTSLADAIVAGWRSPFRAASSGGLLRNETSLVVDEETGLVVRTRVPIQRPRFVRNANGHLGAVEVP